MMAWLYLGLAGLFEIGFTTAMRFIGQTWWSWSALLFLISAALSFHFLTLAIQTIPLGTAYAVWTGIGAFGTALLGIVLFKEPVDALRLFFLITLIGSIIGLKLASPP
jgi:quaternary ammonium compound-resistance protein SugE